MTDITGGCLCGEIRYRAAGEAKMAGHCHCLDCRKTSGTGHSSHLVVAKDALEVTGAPTVYERPADSGNMVGRAFCARCGSPVYSTNSAMPELAFLRASSLDDPELFQPQFVVYTSRAPSWDSLEGSGLQGYPTMPEFRPQ